MTERTSAREYFQAIAGKPNVMLGFLFPPLTPDQEVFERFGRSLVSAFVGASVHNVSFTAHPDHKSAFALSVSHYNFRELTGTDKERIISFTEEKLGVKVEPNDVVFRSTPAFFASL